jgi:membrane-associated phospholipid phosphatase
VGRARPYENLGTSHFDGFRPESVGSGFASNHVAIAFALATPFAQRHDMPWLYAAAGLSALGRLQQRDHWLSDTVAGAAMGYTIGSLLTLQDANKKGPRYTVTPQSVQAQWSFN